LDKNNAACELHEMDIIDALVGKLLGCVASSLWNEKEYCFCGEDVNYPH